MLVLDHDRQPLQVGQLVEVLDFLQFDPEKGFEASGRPLVGTQWPIHEIKLFGAQTYVLLGDHWFYPHWLRGQCQGLKGLINRYRQEVR